MLEDLTIKKKCGRPPKHIVQREKRYCGAQHTWFLSTVLSSFRSACVRSARRGYGAGGSGGCEKVMRPMASWRARRNETSSP